MKLQNKLKTILARFKKAPQVPIGYFPLCQLMLDAGVHSKHIIRHRFVIQAIAAGLYTEPLDIIPDVIGSKSTPGFTLTLVGHKKRGVTRTAECWFANMSGSASVTTSTVADDGVRTYSMPARLSMFLVPNLMLALFPVEDDFTWTERLRIWMERKWMAIRT